MTASLKLKLVKVSTGSVGLDNLYFCAFAALFSGSFQLICTMAERASSFAFCADCSSETGPGKRV